jgi:rod shape-determining protein MreD
VRKVAGRSRMFLLLAAALFFHILVLNKIKIFSARPDIILIIVVFYALFFGKTLGFQAGLIGGFLKDLYAFDIFGINTFILALAGFAIGALNASFYKESPFIQFLVILTSSLFSMLAHYALISLTLKPLGLNISEYFWNIAMPASAYTALLAMPIFYKLIQVYGIREDEQYL